MRQDAQLDSDDAPLLEEREARLDYEQLRNIVNGDTCFVRQEQPLAARLLEFLVMHPDIAVRWVEFNRERGEVR